MLKLIKNYLKKKYYERLHHHLNVEISAMCNYDCKICGFQEFYQPKGLMTMETFMKLEETFKKVDSVIFGFNAETFMNPQVVEMLKFAKRANPNLCVSILTNGSLLTPKLSEQLILNGLDDLSISIDAALPETYKKLRRHSFEKIVQNIQELNQLKEKHNSRLPMLSTNFVAIKDNIHELLAFIDLAKELKIGSVRLTNVEPYTREVQDAILYGDNYTDEVKQIIEKANEKCKSLGIIFSYPEFKKDENARCEFMQPIVDWQGNVIPCSQFSYTRDTLYYGKKAYHLLIVMGNINEKSFKEIWDGRAYRKFRKDVVKGKGPEFCYNYCLLREKVLCPK
jgi:MoaA/NifB/PqqE/SkfB family radical SAM enzyme